MSVEVISLVNYYARSGYYRHVQTVCNEVLKKRSNDPLILFWRAFGMAREGSANEAVRELDGLLRRNDAQLALPVKIALLHAHRACRVVDSEAVGQLETDLIGAEDDNSVPDRARLQSALLLWHLGEYFDAKQHVTYLLRMQPNNVQALTLAGWLELSEGEAELAIGGDPDLNFDKAASAFEKAIGAGGGKKDLEAMMGQAKLSCARENHKEALNTLSEVIGLYAWFLPALVEKSLVLLAMGDWEQAVETAQRVLNQSDSEGGRQGARAGTIDALRVCALHAISQESNPQVAGQRLTELSAALDRHEPMNAPLYHGVARPFARLAGRNPALLALTLSLTDKACKAAPHKAEYAAEHAYQLMLLGDYGPALTKLKQASAMEDGADEVMPYLIRCQILSGDLLDAEMQLEFVKELQSTPNPQMALNNALVAWRRHGDADQAISHLDAALEAHMATVRTLRHNVEYFVHLNPDFLLEVGREYLRHCDSEPGARDEASPTSLLLTKVTKLLHIVAKQVPGLLDGQMLLAKAHYLRADFEGAQRACASCSKADPSFTPAALLHAQILMRLDKFKQAGQVIDGILSHNFAVREAPLFQLIKAKLHHVNGEFAEAEQILTRAIKQLPPPHATASAGGDAESELSPSDRCSLHTQLVEAFLGQQKLSEASSAMSTAVVQFDGTAQEGMLTIINAKVQVAKGEIETALTLLRAMPADNAHYHAARRVLADLYLEHRNDKRAYAACHEEVAAANPTVASYVMLGEAYMVVSEPEKAIAAFEHALAKSPNDAALASRIGTVLVTTHAYTKAIEYYSDAVTTDPSKASLRYELANLFYALKKYDRAVTEINQLTAAWLASEGGDKAAATSDMLEDIYLVTKSFALLAKILKAKNALPEALEALLRAQKNQAVALTRTRSEGGSDQQAAQRTVAADLCVELGSTHEANHDQDASLASYQEALKHDDSHETAILAVGRILLSRGDHDAAEAQCTALMNLDPESYKARMLLADCLLQKSEWEAAIYHLEQMLAKQPALYGAIVKLLTLLRRAGRLQEAPKFLKAAERSSPKAPLEPGFRYCQGVLARFQNSPRSALRHLNMARKDGEWGEAALSNMIEIYLNPENETNWDDLNVDANVEPSEAVRAADKLLREMPPSPRREVLSCYVLMAYKMRNQIDKAVAILLDLLGVEKDYLPALVCLSQAYLMVKQAPKARNHLKRVAKIQFSAEFVDDFERGWLMLADVYIGGGKYDLAEELCWRCLATNKSCGKAWEFLGVVKEKEAAYKDAASHYEKAWNFENEASAAVGYKLSFNYLKAKKYVEAIDVCHKVLSQFPDYPRIKTDVLDAARDAIRP